MILIGAFGLFWFGKSQFRFLFYFILRYCTVSAPYSGMQSRPSRKERRAGTFAYGEAHSSYGPKRAVLAVADR